MTHSPTDPGKSPDVGKKLGNMKEVDWGKLSSECGVFPDVPKIEYILQSRDIQRNDTSVLVVQDHDVK